MQTDTPLLDLADGPAIETPVFVRLNNRPPAKGKQPKPQRALWLKTELPSCEFDSPGCLRRPASAAELPQIPSKTNWQRNKLSTKRGNHFAALRGSGGRQWRHKCRR